MPSDTVIVPNSSGKPPASRTPSLARSASLRSVRLQGVTSFHDDATPIWGLTQSSSPIPTARNMARAAGLLHAIGDVLRTELEGALGHGRDATRRRSTADPPITSRPVAGLPCTSPRSTGNSFRPAMNTSATTTTCRPTPRIQNAAGLVTLFTIQSKFMPKKPVMKVSGRNTIDTKVSQLMT